MMKLNLLRQFIFLTSILAALSLKAEEHYNAHVSVGVHGGTTLSKVSFAPSVDQAWEMGSTVGVSLRYMEEKIVGLKAEVNYIQRGWAEKYEKSPLSYRRALHYFSMPIMTHVNFGGRRAKCFFDLGPELALMFGQTTHANFDYHNPTQAEGWPERKRMTEQLTAKVTNHFDYGICAGAGFEYYLKPRNSVQVSVRYYFGLGNIYPSSVADTFSASRNMSLQLTLGYNFRIK